MASVREELIAELVESDLDCSKEEATKAVDKAIEANQSNESFGKDIEETANMIYDNQDYWED